MVRLQHGTTRKRAEAILANGPDPKFVEPGGSIHDPAGGFSTARPEGPFPFGSPQEYATGKAQLFPEEGGPAIVELEAPDEIVALALQGVGDIRFIPRYGLEELLVAWSSFTKRIITP